jgi:uncharacterized protein
VSISLVVQFLTFTYAAVCIFCAAIVRGYSGFGFSLLAITSISLLLPPEEIVPSIFVMEVAASLAHVPAAPMTLALAVFVLAAAVLLAKGHEMKRMPGPMLTFATGTASGLCNGGFGMGGPPVVLFFFSSPTGAAAGRASLIAFFLLTDLVGLGWQGWSGLITLTTFWRAALFLPPLTAGIWLGNRNFKRADPTAVRRWILRLLMLLALLSGARAMSQLL